MNTIPYIHTAPSDRYHNLSWPKSDRLASQAIRDAASPGTKVTKGCITATVVGWINDRYVEVKDSRGVSLTWDICEIETIT